MEKPVISADECISCGICVDNCPEGALDLGSHSAVLAKEDKCVGCGSCEEDCPMGAITLEEEE